jgi:hypothetical protein
LLSWQSERGYASRPANGDVEGAQAWNSYKRASAAAATAAASAAKAADTQSPTTKPRKNVQLQFERKQLLKTKVLEGDVSALRARDKHKADCKKRQRSYREFKKVNQKSKIKSPLIGTTNSKIRREEVSTEEYSFGRLGLAAEMPRCGSLRHHHNSSINIVFNGAAG